MFINYVFILFKSLVCKINLFKNVINWCINCLMYFFFCTLDVLLFRKNLASCFAVYQI